MELRGPGRFVVQKIRDEPDWRFYRIEEREDVRAVRSFTGRITQTQATRTQVTEQIARWCDIHPEKLPDDDRTIDIDLDYVERP